MENPEENSVESAESTANAVYEYAIVSDTRSFLEGLEPKTKKPSAQAFYITSIAATILILVAAMITINSSHSDSAIAENYGINKLVSRTGENVSNDKFTDAVRSYYENDFDKAKVDLSEVDVSNGKISDYVDWLTLLIELQTNGSDSADFSQALSKILLNDDHMFYDQGRKMDNDIKLFWRSLVF